MGSRALAGLAQGLGQGIADLGRSSLATQVQEQRDRRLAQYRRDEYAQQRADKQADYAQQRADTRADLEEQRGWQTENEQRLYGRSRADAEADYQRNRRDNLADLAHSEARADKAAQLAAQLQADKWSSLQPVKTRDEFGNEQVSGFVGSKGGQMQMIDLQSGRIIPLADDQQRLAALSGLVNAEANITPEPAPAQEKPATATLPEPDQRIQGQPSASASSFYGNFEQDLQALTERRRQIIEAGRVYQPVSRPIMGPPPQYTGQAPWAGGGQSNNGLLSYIVNQQ